MKSCRKVDEISLGGIYLGSARAVKLDYQRIQIIVNKIVQGLFFHRTGRILGDSCVVEECWCQPTLDQNVMERIWGLPIYNVGDGSVFSYRYEVPDLAGGESSWVLMFYNEVLVIATTAPVTAPPGAIQSPP